MSTITTIETVAKADVPASAHSVIEMPSTLVIKASGEAFGTDTTPLYYPAFRQAAEQIRQILLEGHRVAVIVGGGNIARGADLARSWNINGESADAAGMLGTGVNAELLGGVLQSLGVRVEVVPRGPLAGMPNGTWGIDAIRGALAEGAVVIISGGLGVSGISSDVAALRLAADIGAHGVLMSKHDVDGVYTADPKTNPSAKRLDRISTKEALAARLGFADRQALEIAVLNHITLRVFEAKDDALLRASRGEQLGTVVHPE